MNMKIQARPGKTIWPSLFGAAFAFLLLSCHGAPFSDAEDLPSYMTDSHGAAGVVWAMFSLAEADPTYLECAEQTLAWLDHVKKTDAEGRVYWTLHVPPPPGDPKRQVKLEGLPLTIRMFFDAHEKTGFPEYRETALAASRWLAEVGADKWETDLGTAYGWPFAWGLKDAGLVAGHSHGLGKFIHLFMRAYQAEPEPAFEKALTGILVNLKTRAIDMEDGSLAWPAFQWSHLEEKDVILTGYCYGQAGLIVPLMELARTMPDLKLSDGTTPCAMANGALRYLMGRALGTEVGHLWPYMRHSKESNNPGFGSGVGGIGWAFLEGYRTNRELGNEDFAAECMKYARSAADYALHLVEAAPTGVFKGGGGSTGFGVCGGAGGTAFMPMLLAMEIGDRDEKFQAQVNQSMRKISALLIESGTPLDGTLAWPLNPRERKQFDIKSDSMTVNLALDYGQTGVLLSLAEMGKYIRDEEILDAAKKAADFIIRHAVKSEEGWKFHRFIHVESPDASDR